MPPGRRYTYGIDVDDRASSSMAKIAATARRELGKVQSELDDTGTSAQKAARLLDAMADDMKVELEKAERASEALRTALGDVADRVNVTEALGKLRGLGVEFEDIEANAEELAASIKKLDGVVGNTATSMKADLGDAADGLDRVSHSGDQSRSVLANLAGNATSELPGIANALGPVNVALGQLAEYAADGNIRMKSLIGLGLGAGAVVGILGAVTSHFDRMAKSKAFDSDRVNAFRKAILDSGDAADVLRGELEETGKILVELPGTIGNIDIAPALNELGLTVDRFTQLAGLSEGQIDEWSQAMIEAGANADAVNAVTIGLVDTHENLATAEERAAVTAQILGESVADNSAAVEENNEALRENTREVQESARQWQDRNVAIAEANGLEQDLAGAMIDSREEINKYNEVMADGEATDIDRANAQLDLIAAFEAQGEAARRNAENEAIAAGRAATATGEGVQAQVDALTTLANNMAPGSYVRAQIEEHIAALNRIPRSISTQVAMQNYTARDQNGTAVVRRAAGGPVSAGQAYVVGDKFGVNSASAELFVPEQDGTIYPSAGGGSVGVGGGGITVNVTAGFGADGDDIANKIVDMLTRWQRSNGSLPWAS